MPNKCWICGSDCYEDLECTKCGPAQPWGPTREDYCEKCGERIKVSPDSDWMCDWLCEECNANRAEAAYERQQEEGFRGGEAAAFEAEEQARIQRELK